MWAIPAFVRAPVSTTFPHAEPLSITLCVGGRTLVTVPADGLYGHMDVDTDERWPYMYGMESHNRVIIDDGLFTPLRPLRSML